MAEKSRLLDFRDHALAKVRDIEELVDVGKNLNTCPYYGTRQTIKPAQVHFASVFWSHFCNIKLLTHGLLACHSAISTFATQGNARISGDITEK
jgi:hypothetical protein